MIFSDRINSVKKEWIELQIEIPLPLLEPVANFLIEEGSPGVTQEELKGVRKGRSERLLSYFAGRSMIKLRSKVEAYLHSLGLRKRSHFRLRTRIIPNENWGEAWKANFKPLRISPSIIVKPPWEEYISKSAKVVLEIDPGMAFGTGHHPSTRMCLQALERLIPGFPQPPSILDVGTGSGVLAIAAQKLGAQRILALDIDPVAIESALKNAAANQIVGNLEFRLGSLKGLRRVFDIVVANLLPQEILQMAPSLAKRISPRGYLIISGILGRQKQEIASAFFERGLKLRQETASKSWACLVLSR
jgi:ribosomal protein L11 methyltransferase